jgi:hypothetical protein
MAPQAIAVADRVRTATPAPRGLPLPLIGMRMYL